MAMMDGYCNSKSRKFKYVQFTSISYSTSLCILIGFLAQIIMTSVVRIYINCSPQPGLKVGKKKCRYAFPMASVSLYRGWGIAPSRVQGLRVVKVTEQFRRCCRDTKRLFNESRRQLVSSHLGQCVNAC